MPQAPTGVTHNTTALLRIPESWEKLACHGPDKSHKKIFHQSDINKPLSCLSHSFPSFLLARNCEVTVNFTLSKTINWKELERYNLLLLVISQEMALQLLVCLMILYTLLSG